MVRPIRVPQRDTGLGGPAALPSIAAQTAPAQASGQLGLQAAGAIGSVVRTVVEREDNLSFVRQNAQSHATLTAGLASAKTTLDDYVKSPEYNDEDYAALRKELFGRAFEDALSGVTHPQIKARLEGRRDGTLEADITADLEENASTLDALAVATASDSAIAFMEAEGVESVAGYVAGAAEAFDRVLSGRPEMRPFVQQERRRVLQAAQATFLKDGARGELRFELALSDGAFDGLGIDVVGPLARKSAERRSELLAEMATDAVLDDNYGVLTDTGGRFHGYTNAPEAAELEALKLDAQGLPEIERGLDVMIARRERRAEVMGLVVRFQNEELESLPDIGLNLELRAAYNQHFRDSVGPWLSNRNVPWQEKEAVIRRNLLGLGVVPEAMQEWVLTQTNTLDIDPDTFRAIADAFAVTDGTPVPGAKSNRDGQTLSASLNMKWLDPKMREVLSFVSRNAGEGPGGAALAIQQAFDFQESQRGPGGGQRPLSADADSKAARKAREADEALRERVELVYGGPVSTIGSNSMARIREMTAAEAVRLRGIPNSTLSDDQILQTATDNAARAFLDTEPAVNLFGRVFMNGPLHAVLEDGKYTTRMIELEILDALEKAGLPTDDGDILQRLVVYQEDGQDPKHFRALILGNEGEATRLLEGPEGQAILQLDGGTSVYQQTVEGLQLAGMESFAEHLEDTAPEDALPVIRSDMISALFLTREDYIGRYTRAFEAADADGHVMEEFIKWGKLGNDEEVRARRDTLTDRVPEGAPVYQVRPGLDKDWDRAYEEKLKELTPRKLFEIPIGLGIPVWNRAGFKPGVAEKLAREAADKKILTELERELGGSTVTVQDINRFVQTGLYPSESGPGIGPLERRQGRVKRDTKKRRSVLEVLQDLERGEP